LTGVTLDPSGAVVPGVVVHLKKEGGGETKSATSDGNGRFGLLLLPPGRYELQASTPDFELVSLPQINIHVTETLRIELHLRLATRFQRAQVSSTPLMVQVDSSALGRVVERDGSPCGCRWSRGTLANRKPLPGVSAGVYNAGELDLVNLLSRRSLNPTMGFTYTEHAPMTITTNWTGSV
jgi:hypothetical protein